MPLARRLMPAILGLSLTGVAVTLAQTAPAPTTAGTMPASAPTTGPVAVTWDQAGKHLGKTASVTGPVMSTYALEEGHLILNVGKDYPEPDRFSILVTVPANAPDADATYLGKTVSVSGKIEIGQGDAPEIRANAADVVVQK